jgi:hypothetical protein
MRAKEFIKESDSGTTVSGSVAPVMTSLGQPITRYRINNRTKYANTPASVMVKRKIQNDRG